MIVVGAGAELLRIIQKSGQETVSLEKHFNYQSEKNPKDKN